MATSDQISIHALREEGDPVRVYGSAPVCQFLSTPSARRATNLRGFKQLGHKISIHALREEGDHFFPCLNMVW